MKSKEYNEIENKILADDDLESRNKLNKEMKKSSIVGLSVIGFIILLSFPLISKVSLLSIISPIWFYSAAILLLIYYIVTLLFSTVFLNVLKRTSILLYYRVYDMVEYIIKALVIVSFLLMFIVTPTTVVGGSMNNTLSSGDKVLVWHMGYSVSRGDIVVINIDNTYGQPKSLYIKRVVAKSGDIVSYDSGSFYVNDTLVENTYMNEAQYINCINIYNDETNTDTTFKVPKGYSIVLGDHRNSSIDSRTMGLIDNDDILGKAIFCFSPSNFGTIKKEISYN